MGDKPSAIPEVEREPIPGRPRFVDGVAVCSVVDCARPFDARGLCRTHYSRWRTGKPLSATFRGSPGACTVDGCAVDAVTMGLCKRHYNRSRAVNLPLDAPFVERPETCEVHGCDRPHGAMGLCHRHYGWKRRGKPLFQFPRKVERCSIGDCDRAITSSTLCASHYTAANRHKLSPMQLDAVLRIPECEVCRRRFGDPGVGARVIDHDHACCPGASGCGNCVRGVLCSHCNVAIGMFAESPQRFRAALAYLGYNPV